MNKLKHCSVCQENFGDRFSFCPVCGEPLAAVAPGQTEAFAAGTNGDAKREETAAATIATPLTAVGAQFDAPAKPAVGKNGLSGFDVIDAKKSAAPKTPKAEAQKPAPKAETPKPVPVTAERSAPVTRTATVAAATAAPRRAKTGDGMYHLTMLQAPSGYGRNLRLGAILGLFLLLTTGAGLYLYDLFTYNLDVAEVDAGVMLTPVYGADDEPIPEEKQPLEKDKSKGGGGGGGGNKDPKPASKGADAPQTPDPPLFRPSVTYDRVDKPSIPIQATTQGPVRTAREDGPYGIKNGALDPSDGPGSGGGQGAGNGGGQGNGDGTGIGNGRGSGRGNGIGNGIGNNRGDDTGDGGEPPPAKPPYSGPPSEPVKILSTPRGRYTEEARKNNVTGSVLLKVTLGAGGQVTGVSVVRGLPYGLTESAIAAARQIKFIPAKKNGQPVTVAKTLDFGFNIY